MKKKCARVAVLLLLGLTPLQADEGALTLQAVVQSVGSQYPPYLIALIERDIAAGRLRQTQGAFDLNFLASGSLKPSGYYDGSNADFVFDQPLPFWGGNVFAGYRISSGSLADYDKTRTELDGELRAGLRVNLLRDGGIDRRRAELWKARLDQELVDPFIHRQHLDIIRSASRSYYNWVAMGLRLSLAEQVLGIAKDREKAITELAAKGMVAPIVKVDNERLVISRQLSVVQARRRFEAAGIELSLFYRDARDEPAIITRHHLPSNFPTASMPDDKAVGPAVLAALKRRPELRRIQLVQQKAAIDQRLAKNALLPHLDMNASISQGLGENRYKDREQTEASVGIEMRVPLQRNEAKGRIQAIQAELERLGQDEKFARERIVAEISDAQSAQKASYEQIGQAKQNVKLALILQEAEAQRFLQGAVDLLALQIREQATADARSIEIDAVAEYFRAQIDFEAATATGPSAPSGQKTSKGADQP